MKDNMEKFQDIVRKMDLDKPSLSFTNNVMRMVEAKEIKWTWSYTLKYALPFGIATILIISIYICNLFGINIIPTNISTYMLDFNYYMRMFSVGVALIFGSTLLLKHLKNKIIK